MKPWYGQWRRPLEKETSYTSTRRILVNSAPYISWIEESSCELSRFPLKFEVQQEQSVWREEEKTHFSLDFYQPQ